MDSSYTSAGSFYRRYWNEYLPWAKMSLVVPLSVEEKEDLVVIPRNAGEIQMPLITLRM